MANPNDYESCSWLCPLPEGHEGPHWEPRYPPPLLPDDDTAVERLAEAMSKHYGAIGFEHATSSCGPGCAKAVMDNLREGGQRSDGPYPCPICGAGDSLCGCKGGQR